MFPRPGLIALGFVVLAGAATGAPLPSETRTSLTWCQWFNSEYACKSSAVIEKCEAICDDDTCTSLPTFGFGCAYKLKSECTCYEDNCYKECSKEPKSGVWTVHDSESCEKWMADELGKFSNVHAVEEKIKKKEEWCKGDWD